VLQLAGAPPLPQGVLTGGYHGKWIDAATVDEAIVSRNNLDAVGGSLGAGAILPISQETCPLGESLQVAKWLAEESAGQCGPCYLGLPAAARGMEDILNGGGPAALEALKQVAKAVKKRGACSHPDGSAMFLESTIKAFTDDLAAHVLGNGCGRPVEGVLPLFEGGRAPTGIPGGGQAEPEAGASRQKIFVDWTLCRGHGLCADILPEVFELGADGFPTVAQAQVPRYAEAKALRAVRRCPALALRIEEDTRSGAPARNNLPVLSQGRGRRALGR
jgi:ferredoxin